MAKIDHDRDYDLFVKVFPIEVSGVLYKYKEELIEVICDLGRSLEIRTYTGTHRFQDFRIHRDFLEYIVQRLKPFSINDRACVEGTLHRFSRICNLEGKMIGLTCRRGTPFIGSMSLMRDVLDNGKSALIVGRPASGKTSKIRDIARYLSTDLDQRVIIVDADNEIAGGGDTPHPSIGYSRRMMVGPNQTQAQVMIAAVENHMPDVLICDELSTRADADAVSTAVKRGVTVIATAHGRTLEDVLKNPSLTAVLGNIKSVTLGDDTARLRGSQKTVLEREMNSFFDVVVELYSFDELGVYWSVDEAIDCLLREGSSVSPEVRRLVGDEAVKISPFKTKDSSRGQPAPPQPARTQITRKR